MFGECGDGDRPPVFLRSDHHLIDAGGTATVSFGRATPVRPPANSLDDIRYRLSQVDWMPDLGARIGSTEWFRGAATCIVLLAGTLALSPGVGRPLLGAAPPALTGENWEQARAQGISPLAWGADSGRRLGSNDLVVPLQETPERPNVELTATLGVGDELSDALRRAGVGGGEASALAGLVGSAVPLDQLRPGTRLDLKLGRRENKTAARPLESLAFRARFDLALSVARHHGQLELSRHPIAIDRTPLRIRGVVGSSLYRSARAAGAPAKAVEAFIKAIATKLSVGSIGAGNNYDIIVEQARAATGEVQLGQLLFAGLERGGQKVQLVNWTSDGKNQWFEASGVGERRGVMAMPVMGRLASGYGLRRHPILGYMRMHKGLDIAAPYGTPIRAAIDGVVASAGRNGGYGNFVKLSHPNGLATGYGHMSRFAVRPGTRVSQGQVIGYVGSTGMSTGPHLHWEVWRNGGAINPRSISFTQVAQLTGQALTNFKARVSALMSVRPAGQ
jgi:murein DD-endopeptidase MepM/ murein hydrolase activator NlpD